MPAVYLTCPKCSNDDLELIETCEYNGFSNGRHEIIGGKIESAEEMSWQEGESLYMTACCGACGNEWRLVFPL